MHGRAIGLSRPRRFVGDLLHFARRVPTVPVQRSMRIGGVVAARNGLNDRPCWPAIFVKAFAVVAERIPALRRAYVGLPWPHLREYPTSIASVAVERSYQNESCVFFGRIANPGQLTLADLHARIRHFAESPVESVKPFRKLLAYAAWPRLLRRAIFWLGLNLPRTRPSQFGTFGLSVYSSLGAESLHPLSPLTVTLTYGVIDSEGSVVVRLVYDHRVFDGTTAARALEQLEAALHGEIHDELRAMSFQVRMAA